MQNLIDLTKLYVIITIMGVGSSDGMLTPPQPGVITYEGENFPIIPEPLLKMSPDETKKLSEVAERLFESELNRTFPNPDILETLEDLGALLEFAQVAVERTGRTVERR